MLWGAQGEPQGVEAGDDEEEDTGEEGPDEEAPDGQGDQQAGAPGTGRTVAFLNRVRRQLDPPPPREVDPSQSLSPLPRVVQQVSTILDSQIN